MLNGIEPFKQCLKRRSYHAQALLACSQSRKTMRLTWERDRIASAMMVSPCRWCSGEGATYLARFSPISAKRVSVPRARQLLLP